MAKPYSMDLRERVMAEVDEGLLLEMVAERFAVSVRTLRNWLALRAESGSLLPRQGEVGRKRKLDPAQRESIEKAISRSPSLDLEELRTKFSLPVLLSTLWSALERWGMTLKKSPVCGRATPR